MQTTTKSLSNKTEIGCIIMASGLSKRFGRNKLLENFQGRTLLEQLFLTLKQVPYPLHLIVVTRYPAVVTLCEKHHIPALLHNLPNRNDTVRLGLEALLANCPTLAGCMFSTGDQPLLTAQSIYMLLESFLEKPACIHRLCYDQTPGNPVIFPSNLFRELLSLPEGKGGSVLIKKHPEQVHLVPIQDAYELYDIDTEEDLLFLSNRFK